jgi:hypothetical protein
LNAIQDSVENEVEYCKKTEEAPEVHESMSTPMQENVDGNS